MTNLAIIPLQDSFETTLSQELGTTGTTIYVNAIPSYSPSNTPTYAVINPKKTNAELVLISNYDTVSKTLTISSRPIARTLGVTPVSQTHPVGSTIIISDNYQFWQNIKTAMNTKIDGIVQGIPFFADASARDSAIPNPTNGLIVGLTTPGKITYYIGGWIDLGTGATFINASTTEAGKGQISTTAGSKLGTDIGTTGAYNWVLPSDIAANSQSNTFIYGHSTTGSDAYTVNLTPALTTYTTGMSLWILFDTANTGACTLNVDGLGTKDIKTLGGDDPQNGDIAAGSIRELVYNGINFILQKPPVSSTVEPGLAEKSTDSEVGTGTDTDRFVTPAQLKTYAGYNKILSTTFTDSLSNYDLGVAHATYSKIIVEFTFLTTTAGYINTTGTLFFDNTSGFGNVVTVGRNDNADEGYGYAPRPKASAALWTTYSYDSAQNNTVTLDKGATNYRISFAKTFGTSYDYTAIFKISYVQ